VKIIQEAWNLRRKVGAMSYFILIVLFIAVFVFVIWRIFSAKPPSQPAPRETYVCPVCNENHCECHKEAPH
jgi:hypothetical protein